jgi:hypothetical protein
MKKLLTLLLVLSAFNSFAQLTLVKETDKDLEPFMLSNGDWMLYSTINSSENKLKSIIFYYQDLSVYKIVDIPQVFPYDTTGFSRIELRLNDIEVVSVGDDGMEYKFTDGFFNTDSKIEFIVQYISVKFENSTSFVRETSYILNEDGTEIQKFDNAIGEVRFQFWKYLNISFSNSAENYKIYNTQIYSVPGNLPCPSSCSQKAAAIAPITPPNEYKGIQVTGFPNPSTDKVTLAYALPEGVAFGTLRLYTQTGELVKEFKVSNQVDHLELPVSDYSPGTYFYELQAGESSSGGKKMVVIH